MEKYNFKSKPIELIKQKEKRNSDRERLKREFEKVCGAGFTVITKEKDYDKIRRQMRSLIRMAKEVIEEVEKDFPSDNLICDVAIEEMAELFDEITSTVLGDCRPAI